ncbi:MAG: hypothetical protein NT062_16515 [Proteobacteria bacterium]|nr:hypothetical protein [Pseudomonadota bacterium]
MLRFAMASLGLGVVFSSSGCRVVLEDPQSRVVQEACKDLTVQVCVDAADHADFTFIHEKILKPNCSSGSCHQSTSNDTKAAKLRFEDYDNAYADLVHVPSRVRTDLEIVVPGEPDKSYLLFLMHAVAAADFVSDLPIADPPESVGFMPRNNSVLCCQKLGAVERWVANGAPKD